MAAVRSSSAGGCSSHSSNVVMRCDHQDMCALLVMRLVVRLAMLGDVKEMPATPLIGDTVSTNVSIADDHSDPESHSDWETHMSEEEVSVDAAPHHVMPISVMSALADAISSRSVQSMLVSAAQRGDYSSALDFRGRVPECIRSTHANHAIQTIIEVMPSTISKFIAAELIGMGAAVARHEYGCRVLCRLIENHCRWDSDMQELFVELLPQVPALSRHKYGCFVVQHILEHGPSDSYKSYVASMLCAHVRTLSQDKHGSRTIEKALDFCHINDRNAIFQELATDRVLLSLAVNAFGNYVVRALLKKPEYSSCVAGYLVPSTAWLKAHNKFGKWVVEDMPKVYPWWSRHAVLPWANSW